MVFRQVGIELLVDSALQDFGNDGYDGDRTEIGRVRRVAGFEDGMDEGVFPGLGDIGLGYARVEQMQEHLTDRVKTRAEHVNADAVLTAGRRAAESKDDSSQL